MSSEGQVLCADDERISGNVQQNLSLVCSVKWREQRCPRPFECVIDDLLLGGLGYLSYFSTDSSTSVLSACTIFLLLKRRKLKLHLKWRRDWFWNQHIVCWLWYWYWCSDTDSETETSDCWFCLSPLKVPKAWSKNQR